MRGAAWVYGCTRDQALRLGGDVAFADCIERAFYNAYIGSMNTRDIETENNRTPVKLVLPFDSYAPLTANERGRKVGGFQIMSDGSFYGCCACIASAGIGMVPEFALMQNDDGIVLNLYYDGAATFATKGGQTATLTKRPHIPTTTAQRRSPSPMRHFPSVARTASVCVSWTTRLQAEIMLQSKRSALGSQLRNHITIKKGRSVA